MADGYEMGPLGVPVMKYHYSTGRGPKSPPKTIALTDAQPVDGSHPSAIGLKPCGRVVASDGTMGSKPCLPVPENGGGTNVMPPKRGSGLRNLLGKETECEEERERGRRQAEALKKQVEDQKVRAVCSRGGMGCSTPLFLKVQVKRVMGEHQDARCYREDCTTGCMLDCMLTLD